MVYLTFVSPRLAINNVKHVQQPKLNENINQTLAISMVVDVIRFYCMAMRMKNYVNGSLAITIHIMSVNN